MLTVARHPIPPSQCKECLDAKPGPATAPALVKGGGALPRPLAACRSARARLLELEMTTVEAAVPAATMRRSSGTSGRPCHIWHKGWRCK